MHRAETVRQEAGPPNMNDDGAATSAGAQAHQLARMRVTTSIQSPTTPLTPQATETPNFLPLTHLGDENVMEGKDQGLFGRGGGTGRGVGVTLLAAFLQRIHCTHETLLNDISLLPS